MKKFLSGFAALAAAVSLVFSGVQIAAVTQAVPASAAVSVAAKKATPAVAIRKIPNKTVKGSAKAKVKPLVTAKKGTKVVSKRLKVVHGRKTLTRSASAISLKAGSYRVTTTVKYKVGKAKQRTTSKTQSLVVKKKASASSKRVYKGYSCPAGYPVKGNRTGSKKEWKYHVKGGQFYSRTKPEECFKTTSAASKAGYRASKR
ncbi:MULTISPECIES: sunset domain-containing protein [Micrococcaceae]|uniref:sunset domain-containing protein n=1 Tax=Micrococcaceae TaxID=1268 RepID=UPI000BB90694|nr:hypothetical protein [Glutamicibacter sp. BW78]PCC24623.1 hypothetical protein CIK75_10535 [Glutamicibacter sp. BW78]